jgi:hypothetical protein
MLTLATFPLPSGRQAQIEDEVVDQDVRDRGVGTALDRFYCWCDGVQILERNPHAFPAPNRRLVLVTA